MCRYCGNDIATLNYARHLQRQHKDEKEVVSAMQFPKNSKERRQAFALLRNETNFDLYIKGILRPCRKLMQNREDTIYYPCSHCKGLFIKSYLKRHLKQCIAHSKTNKESRTYHLTDSQTAIACAVDATETISKLNVKEQVSRLIKYMQTYNKRN